MARQNVSEAELNRWLIFRFQKGVLKPGGRIPRFRPDVFRVDPSTNPLHTNWFAYSDHEIPPLEDGSSVNSVYRRHVAREIQVTILEAAELFDLE